MKEMYKSFTTGEAITANSLVTLSGSNIIMCDALAEEVLGVVSDAVASGGIARVQLFGVAKVRSTAAAITVGDELSPSTTDGQCLTAAGSGTTIFGKAMTATGTTADELVEVLLYADKTETVP